MLGTAYGAFDPLIRASLHCGGEWLSARFYLAAGAEERSAKIEDRFALDLDLALL